MQELEFIQIPRRLAALLLQRCDLLPVFFVGLQRAIVLEFLCGLLDRGRDIVEGVVDLVLTDALREVGEDEEVGVALERGEELGGELFVDFVCAGFDDYEGVFYFGQGRAAGVGWFGGFGGWRGRRRRVVCGRGSMWC